MILMPWLRLAGKPSMTNPFAFSDFFISSPNSRTTSSWNAQNKVSKNAPWSNDHFGFT